MRRFWETESLGIHMETEQNLETDAVWKFKELVQVVQHGRQEVCLPWSEIIQNWLPITAQHRID